MSNSIELINKIALFLQSKGLEPQLLKTKPACKFEHNYNSIRYTCYIILEYDLSMLIFYFIPPITVATKKEALLPVAEYLTRANYGMIFGNFELDFNDGEVRYKKIIDWSKTTLEMDEIINTIKSGISVWGIYFPPLLSILDDDIAADVAISRV